MKISIHNKMEIPKELYAHEIIRYLPVKDILRLCTTNISLSKICQENATWKFLIGRDFKGEFPQGDNPKSQYFYAKYIHDMSDIRFEHTSNLPRGIRLLGYSIHGKVLKLDQIDVGRIYVDLITDHENSSSGLWYEGWVSLGSFYAPNFQLYQWEGLLPEIFSIIQKEDMIYIGMDIFHLAQIYDYYYGPSSFWNGFVKSAQLYFDSLHPDLVEDFRDWMNNIFTKIHPNSSTLPK